MTPRKKKAKNVFEPKPSTPPFPPFDQNTVTFSTFSPFVFFLTREISMQNKRNNNRMNVFITYFLKITYKNIEKVKINAHMHPPKTPCKSRKVRKTTKEPKKNIFTKNT